MSYVVAGPKALAAAANDLSGVGSTISDANAAAAASTTEIQAAAADAVSAVVAQLYNSHAQTYQTISSQMASFHDQFVRAINGSGNAYANADEIAAAALQGVASAINAPARGLLGG